MSKKKMEKLNETKQEKFKRISEPRLIKAIYQINRLKKMTESNTYQITDVDAQSIIDAYNKYIKPVFEIFNKIATNEPIEEEEKKEDVKIF